jgi:dienelactone hydrolase
VHKYRTWVRLQRGGSGAALAIAFLVAVTQAAAAGERLTSLAALESHAVISNPGDVSPDGSRYVLRVIHADRAANNITVDILTGTLGSLEEAASPKVVAHLVTSGLGSSKYQFAASFDALPVNELHWMGNSKIALIWSGAQERRQVFTIDLRSGAVVQLTDVPAQVTQFLASEQGALLFNSLIPDSGGDSSERIKNGFAAGKHADAITMLEGEFDDRPRLTRNNSANWFLRDSAGAMRPVLMNGQLIDYANPYFRIMKLSPDGRRAFINLSINQAPPASWQDYKNGLLHDIMNADKKEGAGFYTSQHPVIPSILDMRTGAIRVLWNAPVNRTPDSMVAWSPNGRFLLMAPTFLPIEANGAANSGAAKDDAGLSGIATAVVDVEKGSYGVVPIDLKGRSVTRLSWQGEAGVTVTSTDVEGHDQTDSSFAWSRGAWRQQVISPAKTPSHFGVTVTIKQDLNTPPLVVARDAQGHERIVLDPTPELRSTFNLGKVASVSGPLTGGGQWHGVLTYPAGYVEGHRYPLVIQSLYGRPMSDDFNLYGVIADKKTTGAGPNFMPSYPGQLLAARDIAVLTVGPIGHTTKSDEAKDRTAAMVAAAREMIAKGVADPDKIGLAGFSRNGYFVEYALTHSDFHFAAAMVADNYSTSYVQSMLRDWWSFDTDIVGVPAFGEGLRTWLQVSPEFNVEKVNAPVLMVAQSEGITTIIGQWEFFSRLRFLQKPVELFVMPDAFDHGAHGTQNPQQVQTVQERVADWFEFWLTGHEDSAESKREQYASWHELRNLQPRIAHVP